MSELEAVLHVFMSDVGWSGTHPGTYWEMWEKHPEDLPRLYCIFILGAISPCITVLEALLTDNMTHPTAQVQPKLSNE